MIGRSPFFSAVVAASSEREIARALMDNGQALFGAAAVGFYSLTGTEVREMHLRGVTDAFAEAYERVGRIADPLMAKVASTHAPATEAIVELRKKSPGYADFGRVGAVNRMQVRQYLLAPIVVDGHLAGAIHVARTSETPFGTDDLLLASTMSLYVSSRVTTLRALSVPNPAWQNVLSEREIEVAELASHGLRVADLARALGISVNTVKKHLKRLYVRLGVASRAELSIKFARGPESVAAKTRRSQPHPKVSESGAVAFYWQNETPGSRLG